MQTQNNNVGISGLAAYVPPLKVQLEDWCEWTNSPWPKISKVVGTSFRVPGPEESVYTMAATAVLRLIEQYQIDPSQIGFLGFGTESSTDNSAGPIIIKGMLDDALAARGKSRISRSCEVPEFKHACLGGVYAMKGALRYLALDGIGRQAIVVCADIAEYARGSSGEPTQGAGAVAMLIENDPKLIRVALDESGSASDYRTMDFRKPMARLCDQPFRVGNRVQDFPVFNGKYSTTCYIDETLHALQNMYQKRGLDGLTYLRSLQYIFMHRPYRRMPETGLGIAYLAALAANPAAGHKELRSYADEVGVDFASLLEELLTDQHVRNMASAEQVGNDAFPCTSAIMQSFRRSESFAGEVLDKLALGSAETAEFGNLYTAALPAWLAAGLDVALSNNLDLAGAELLTMGYGSGDAAEVIPFYVVDGWQEAARKICFSDVMTSVYNLSRQQYEALHDRVAGCSIDHRVENAFVVTRVGSESGRHFSDAGIEYHRYAESARKTA